MSGGWIPGVTILLPPRKRRAFEPDPLIEEAWDRHHRRRRRIMVSLLLVAGISVVSITLWIRNGQAGTNCVATSNCSASTASAASGIPNPCALLATPEVVRALGSKLANRIPQQSSGHRTCMWNMEPLANETFSSAHAILTLIVSRSTETQFARSAQAEKLTPIRGVGDLAYWTPNSPVVFLTAWARGYSVALNTTDVVSPLNVEKTLALQVLKKPLTALPEG